jgi:glycosyltransferase involved in cell wall biosynthesis
VPDDNEEAPVLSVVVPTRDRPDALRACLAALADQRDAGSIEFVVVDDGSVAGGSVARIVSTLRDSRCVRQPAAGVSAARNTGVRAARAPLVLFTDDDCIVQPGWAATLRRRLEAGADVVAGSTVIGRRGDVLAAASQLISNAIFLGLGGPASNFACRREVLLAVPFDEHYRVAADDRDWYARLAYRGYEVGFERDAVVLHFPELTLRRFWRKHVGYGRGAYRFRHTHRGGRLERPGFYVGLLRAGFVQGPDIGLAVLIAQLATAAGFVREALGGLAARVRGASCVVV